MVHLGQDQVQRASQIAHLLRVHLPERCHVAPRINPHRKRSQGSEGNETHKMLRLVDDPGSLGQFLLHDLAKQALAAVVIEAQRLLHPVPDIGRNDGGGDDLRMRMFQGSARGDAVILEDRDILNPGIVDEGEVSLLIASDDEFHLLFREERGGGAVVGGLDDHLVEADAGHGPLQPLGFAEEFSLARKGGKFIRNHADLPISIAGDSQGLGRSQVLVARAERTLLGVGGKRRRVAPLLHKFVGPPRPLGRDNHPLLRDRILPQFWHRSNPLGWSYASSGIPESSRSVKRSFSCWIVFRTGKASLAPKSSRVQGKETSDCSHAPRVLAPHRFCSMESMN